MLYLRTLVIGAIEYRYSISFEYMLDIIYRVHVPCLRMISENLLASRRNFSMSTSSHPSGGSDPSGTSRYAYKYAMTFCMCAVGM